MKILMLEHYNETGKPGIAKGEEREDIKPKLRDWLIEHGKAVEVKPETPKPEPEPDPVVEEEEKSGIKGTLENLFSAVVSDNDKPLEEVTEENKDTEKESLPVENVMQAPKLKKKQKKGKRKGGKK